MLIPKDYILSNEIAKIANIHVANFSMLMNEIEDKGIFDTMVKYGACTFVNKNSSNIPMNIFKHIHKNKGKFTDLEDYILLTYFKNQFEVPQNGINDLLKLGIITEVKTVEGKKFIKLRQDITDSLKNKVITNINEKDFNEFKNEVEGFKLSKNNFLIWY